MGIQSQFNLKHSLIPGVRLLPQFSLPHMDELLMILGQWLTSFSLA